MNKDEIAKLIKHEADALLQIPITDDFQKAIDLIVTQVHKNKGKLVTSGMGKAGQIAMNIATTFSSTGTPSVFLHASEAQHGDLGLLQENDLLLLISNSGKTREIIELAQLAKGLHDKIQFVLITGNMESPLSSSAAAVLCTGNPAEVCPLGLSPTTSTTMMTVIGDVLVVGTMTAIGFKNEDYAKRHHGGYLGQKSKSMLD
jgi:arabinose-5-phosphate isomerase